jgi:N-acetylmuramoyl-L-alanine amidase
MKKLVIDLGHGGTDPGAIGQNGTHEANIANAFGADYFVSIHINSAEDTSVRGVKFSKELYVLRNTNMPACLIEVDFVSNKDAENDFKAISNIKSVASAIMKNILTLYDLDVKEDVL